MNDIIDKYLDSRWQHWNKDTRKKTIAVVFPHLQEHSSTVEEKYPKKKNQIIIKVTPLGVAMATRAFVFHLLQEGSLQGAELKRERENRGRS